jgi:hypothetical protein
MSGPTTKAGKRLVKWLADGTTAGHPALILDVELEAERKACRAALLALRERVEGLPHGSSCALVVMNVGGCDCHLAAVLRLIDEPTP